MKGKLSIIIIVGLFCTFGAASSALALSYTTTASDSGPGAGITYTLDYGLISGQDYWATFKITETLGSVSPQWDVGWVIFKLDGSGPITISSLTPGSTGPWQVAYGSDTTNVLSGGGQYSQLLPANGQDNKRWSGFYVQSLASGNTPDPSQGVVLTSTDGTSTYTFTFVFTVPVGNSASTDSIPFQVGYYDGKKWKW